MLIVFSRTLQLHCKVSLSMHILQQVSTHIWQQRNVASQVINTWLTATFSVLDRVTANRYTQCWTLTATKPISNILLQFEVLDPWVVCCLCAGLYCHLCFFYFCIWHERSYHDFVILSSPALRDALFTYIIIITIKAFISSMTIARRLQCLC